MRKPSVSLLERMIALCVSNASALHVLFEKEIREMGVSGERQRERVHDDDTSLCWSLRSVSSLSLSLSLSSAYVCAAANSSGVSRETCAFTLFASSSVFNGTAPFLLGNDTSVLI
jgi:hypothetical protein